MVHVTENNYAINYKRNKMAQGSGLRAETQGSGLRPKNNILGENSPNVLTKHQLGKRKSFQLFLHNAAV